MQEQSERKERKPLEYAFRSFASELHPYDNQDTYYADESNGLVGLFDGMGGLAAGREASETAAAAVQEYVAGWEAVTDEEADDILRPSLASALRYAGTKVVELGNAKKLAIPDPAEREKFQMPGTTATLVKIHEFKDGRRVAYVANIGDSRVYVWRADEAALEQVSEDDDVLSDPDYVQQLAARFQREITAEDIMEYRARIDSVAGEEDMPDDLGRKLFRLRNVVTRSLGGSQRMSSARTYAVALEPGDIVFVTSDGVHDNLTRERIATIAATSATADDLVQRLAMEAAGSARLAPRKYAKGQPMARNKPDDITAGAIKT